MFFIMFIDLVNQTFFRKLTSAAGLRDHMFIALRDFVVAPEMMR
jgi:hypothetical protein